MDRFIDHSATCTVVVKENLKSNMDRFIVDLRKVLFVVDEI